MNNNEKEEIPVVSVESNDNNNSIPVNPMITDKNTDSLNYGQTNVSSEITSTVANQSIPPQAVNTIEQVELNQSNNIQNDKVTSSNNQVVSNQQNNITEVKNTELNNDNKGPTTFAKIMTTLLFIFLFAFVYFLGDITEFINQKKLEKQLAEITNGRLICSKNSNTESLDVKINATFSFENKEITGLTYITTSTGDKVNDKEELENLKNECSTLKNEVQNYEGVSIVCSLNNGINSVKQIFDYQKIDINTISSAYSEAGGVYPQFELKESIDSVEYKMISSGYTCEKVSD